MQDDIIPETRPPAPLADHEVSPMTRTTDTEQAIATLGGGCFWCIEAVFDQLRGVASVESGYMGGQQPNPSYEDVCTGQTGHAEVIRVTFDPTVIAYRTLLEIFFSVHDPTTLNRQGNDIGTQYRSVIFYHSPEQETIAKDVMAALASGKHFHAPIVTEVSPACPMYMAEDYHQQYFARHPTQPYCTLLIAPKIAKCSQQFASKMKRSP